MCVTAAIRAGVDSNCGSYLPTALPWALGNGTLKPSDLGPATRRLLAARFRLGLFESDGHPGVPRYGLDAVDSASHRQLALEAARQGIVLLKNDPAAAAAAAAAAANTSSSSSSSLSSSSSATTIAAPRSSSPLLPLVSPQGKTSLRTVALLGPNANATRNLLGGYHGTPPPFGPVSALAAMRAGWPAAKGDANGDGAAGDGAAGDGAAGDASGAGAGTEAVKYGIGCSVNGPPAGPGHAAGVAKENASIAEAVALAAQADVTVLVLGLCGNNYANEDPNGQCATPTETEGTDRRGLQLPGRQQELLERVVGAAGADRVVLVMVNAGPVDLSWAKAHVRAIVWAGYGGQAGGQAIADVLLGKFSPGGALPYTVYTQQYADAVSFADMGMRPNKTTGNPGRSHRFLPAAAATSATSAAAAGPSSQRRSGGFEPVWRFGTGLSYTTFSLQLVQPQTSINVAVGDTTDIIVRVTNMGGTGGNSSSSSTGSSTGGGGGGGGMASDVVVACYVSAQQQDAVPDPPVRSLFDFARSPVLAPPAAALAAAAAGGQSTLLSFKLRPEHRTLVRDDGSSVTPTGVFAVHCEAGGPAVTSGPPLLLNVVAGPRAS